MSAKAANVVYLFNDVRAPVQQAKCRGRYPRGVISITSLPRLRVGDVVELCGQVLPSNLGKLVLIEGFDNEGYVEIKSLSGKLDSRDPETGEITLASEIHVSVLPECCYRRSRDLLNRRSS